MGKKYIDKYGQVWGRVNSYQVWKPDTGYGGWYDGAGLVALL